MEKLRFLRWFNQQHRVQDLIRLVFVFVLEPQVDVKRINFNEVQAFIAIQSLWNLKLI